MNPWSKNPFLSMWLSGSNAVFGAARGRAIGEMHRQTTMMMNEGTKQAIRFWSGALGVPATRGTRRRKSSRKSRHGTR